MTEKKKKKDERKLAYTQAHIILAVLFFFLLSRHRYLALTVESWNESLRNPIDALPTFSCPAVNTKKEEKKVGKCSKFYKITIKRVAR